MEQRRYRGGPLSRSGATIAFVLHRRTSGALVAGVNLTRHIRSLGSESGPLRMLNGRKVHGANASLMRRATNGIRTRNVQLHAYTRYGGHRDRLHAARANRVTN